MDCLLRAEGRRFAAKRYLATSTLLPETVGEHHFEFLVGSAKPGADAALVAEAERFLGSPRLDLTRLFTFPGVERVTLVFRGVAAGQPFRLPARICAALGKHGLELEVERGLQSEQT